MTPQEAQELREAIEETLSYFDEEYSHHPKKEDFLISNYALGLKVKHLRSLLALHDAGESQGWKPIESCPEEKPVLLFYEGCGIGVGVLSDACDKDNNDVGKKFFVGLTWGHAQYFGIPTHWMPLPKPPQPVSDPDKLQECKRCQGAGRWGPDETPDAYECDECQIVC